MTGYTKLFGSLIGSTLWRDDSKELKIVWITMLALVNRDGIVEASIPGLADFAKVSIEECEAALERLQEPDEYSRTPDHEGRRIEKIQGGWRVLNYKSYRQKFDEDDRRAYWAARKRKERERKKSQPLPGEPEYVKADRDGDQKKCDEIAARGLKA